MKWVLRICFFPFYLIAMIFCRPKKKKKPQSHLEEIDRLEAWDALFHDD